LQSVVQSWEPKPPQAVWFNRLIDLSVKPIQRYENLYVVLESWLPPPQPMQRRPVVTPSGPAIVAVYREIVIRGNDPSGTEDYYEQWFG